MKIVLVLLLCLLSVWTVKVHAQTTVYVDALTGNDTNDGSTAQTAFQTLSKALSVQPAGTEPFFITIEQGTYKGEKNRGLEITHGTVRFNGDANFQSTVISLEGADRFFHAKNPGTHVVVRDLLIEHGSAQEGGAVKVVDATVEFDHVSIRTSTGTISGGGVYFRNSPGSSFHNCLISNCNSILGGLVYIEESDPLFMDTSLLSGNSTLGGGVYLANSASASPMFEGSIFTTNQATANGGAILIEGTSLSLPPPTFYNCSFHSNKVLTTGHNGGAIYLNITQAVLLNHTVFDDNHAHAGGAVYAHDGAVVEVIGGAFTSNIAGTEQQGDDGYGGAIYMSNGFLTLTDVNFNGNAATRGGAVFATGLADSVAPPKGGVCGIDDTLIDGCTFESNTAIESAGAVYVDALDCSVTIRNTFFNKNLLIGLSSDMVVFGGGAIHGRNSVLHVSGGLFENNTVVQSVGGAVRLVHCPNSTFDETEFHSNIAATGGGAVSLATPEDQFMTLFKQVKFRRNTAGFTADPTAQGSGGAIEITRSTPIFVGCEFYDNVAQANGGAFHANGDFGSLPHFLSCSFVGNTAVAAGMVGYLRGDTQALFQNTSFSPSSLFDSSVSEFSVNEQSNITFIAEDDTAICTGNYLSLNDNGAAVFECPGGVVLERLSMLGQDTSVRWDRVNEGSESVFFINRYFEWTGGSFNCVDEESIVELTRDASGLWKNTNEKILNKCSFINYGLLEVMHNIDEEQEEEEAAAGMEDLVLSQFAQLVNSGILQLIGDVSFGTPGLTDVTLSSDGEMQASSLSLQAPNDHFSLALMGNNEFTVDLSTSNWTAIVEGEASVQVDGPITLGGALVILLPHNTKLNDPFTIFSSNDVIQGQFKSIYSYIDGKRYSVKATYSSASFSLSVSKPHSNSSNGGISGGGIAAIVIGVLFAVLIVAFIVWRYRGGSFRQASYDIVDDGPSSYGSL